MLCPFTSKWNRQQPPCGTALHSKGVTLIEVLVAIIILSIGLLGIAGLQVATAKYRLGSSFRSATAALYSDYTDRIRMNPDMAGPNAISGGLATAITSSDLDSSKYTFQATWAAQQLVTDAAFNSLIASATSACDGGSSACTPTNRATHDMLTWRKRVRDSLPQGAVYVTGNSRVGIEVTLMWMDKDNTNKSVSVSDGGTATQVSLVTALSCSAVTAATGMALQTCCPDNATVIAGVRCTRFSFTP